MANYTKTLGRYPTSARLQERIKDLHLQGKTSQEIADDTGISKATVRRRRKAVIEGKPYTYVENRGEKEKRIREETAMDRLNKLWKIPNATA